MCIHSKIGISVLGLAMSFGLTGCYYPAQPNPTPTQVQYVNNSALVSKVQAALTRDPDIDLKNSAIVVMANRSTVQLMGCVGSYREKQSAIFDAQNVPGVTQVVDTLVVKKHK